MRLASFVQIQILGHKACGSNGDDGDIDVNSSQQQ